MNAQSNVTKTKERFYAPHTKILWDANPNHCVLQDPKTPRGNIVLPIPFAQKSASGMRYNALMGWTRVVAKMQTCVLQERRTSMEIFVLRDAHQNVPIHNSSASAPCKVMDAEDNPSASSRNSMSMESFVQKYVPRHAQIGSLECMEEVILEDVW
jgi:hypothetical protein